ncbi:hypothetical protein BDB01DRAFT_831997 [Pilobolus umbonatus]|nr:hypothetical protein BDB01DRAFT_831997 [Pilobolus umbonatus]
MTHSNLSSSHKKSLISDLHDIPLPHLEQASINDCQTAFLEQISDRTKDVLQSFYSGTDSLRSIIAMAKKIIRTDSLFYIFRAFSLLFNHTLWTSEDGIKKNGLPLSTQLERMPAEIKFKCPHIHEKLAPLSGAQIQDTVTFPFSHTEMKLEVIMCCTRSVPSRVYNRNRPHRSRILPQARMSQKHISASSIQRYLIIKHKSKVPSNHIWKAFPL